MIESSNIGYQGDLNISLSYKNKILKTIRKHNAGSSALFKFIGYCLSGQYNAANVVGRPFKIRLYGDKNFQRPITNLITASSIASVDTKDNIVGENNYCIVTLRFNIPSLYFTSRNHKTVFAAKLFPVTAEEASSNLENNYCASVIFSDNEDKITLPSNPSQEILLIVTWSLIISNRDKLIIDTND